MQYKTLFYLQITFGVIQRRADAHSGTLQARKDYNRAESLESGVMATKPSIVWRVKRPASDDYTQSIPFPAASMGWILDRVVDTRRSTFRREL